MGRRNVAIGLVFLGAALMVFGVLFRDWWSGNVFYGTTLSIGLRSMEMCSDGECTTGSLESLVGGEHGGWVVVGSILFYVGLVTAAILLLVGGLEVARKRVRLPIAPTTLGFLLSAAVLLLGFVFVMLKPSGLNGTGLQAGLAFFIVAAGGISGVMGAIYVAKGHSVQDNADWLEDVSQEHAAEAAPAPWLSD